MLGALSITKRPGEPITPVESKLLSDLASQAGVVFRNVKLNEQLLARLDELQASRQRVLTAQYQARRQLERDLHDGAQQQLVALKVKISLAERIATEEKVKKFLSQLQKEADDTLQTLRDLARGIYPPLLADKGLVVALTAQANKNPLPVTVEGDVGRYGQEVEAAVYFCCLEALQNIAKYAGECEVWIKLSSDAESLSFEVRDNGAGFESSYGYARPRPGKHVRPAGRPGRAGSRDVEGGGGDDSSAGRFPSGPWRTSGERRPEPAVSDTGRDSRCPWWS